MYIRALGPFGFVRLAVAFVYNRRVLFLWIGCGIVDCTGPVSNSSYRTVSYSNYKILSHVIVHI
jgi:hypothetical protein